MEVILLKDVENLGDANAVVKVKDGYGRNFLIPRGLAVVANDGNKRMLEELKRQTSIKEAKMMAEVEKMAGQFKDNVIRVGAKVGQNDKIFGSVTNVQLAEAIRTQLGVLVDRKKISMEEDVKSLGNYSAHISLSAEKKVEVKFEVVEE
ncbi:MAG: 50S ribosomal protein L9 [Chitinophagales bacterium]|nr:50S ribosomal protein L9 [Chitinophagales bacterium]HAE35245.1 50S ribosomal protein L9 [Bacteroidota bacterium]MCB9019348.1 50S ribosomal protein L9 [Chitinophagales bacterium]MCB9020598.1 50S ribosomal protein L9 [Chitinophagales bacterium]MCB9031450.1 50S ribosomal protein L9 [Chitinophagales bacterium]